MHACIHTCAHIHSYMCTHSNVLFQLFIYYIKYYTLYGVNYTCTLSYVLGLVKYAEVVQVQVHTDHCHCYMSCTYVHMYGHCSTPLRTNLMEEFLEQLQYFHLNETRFYS